MSAEELKEVKAIDFESIVNDIQAGLENESWYAVADSSQRPYVGRKIHVNWKIAHLIPGLASHLAWDVLVATGQTKAGSALRTEFGKHVDMTRKIIKAIYTRLIANAGPITVTIGGPKTPKISVEVNFGGRGRAGRSAAVTA